MNGAVGKDDLYVLNWIGPRQARESDHIAYFSDGSRLSTLDRDNFIQTRVTFYRLKKRHS